MNPPLLSAKLTIPPNRPRLVARRRLFNQLAEGLGRKLTVISAPAGFGKTTLVVDWLAHFKASTKNSVDHSSLKVGWLSLDQDDNDPARFLTYLIAAVQQLDAAIGREIQATLNSPQLPQMQYLLMSLVHDIFEALGHRQSTIGTTARPQTFILVLDDYHLINHQTIHTALHFLIDHMPPQMHVIITSRIDPPLPLSRWRARVQLLEIRAAALSFTLQETTEFLQQVAQVTLKESDIQTLEQRTEGWIAGLQLAALSLKDQADATAFVTAFAGNDRYIFDYLVDEVLDHLPQHIQSFLLQTSFLDRLCGPLCDAVLDKDLDAKPDEDAPIVSQEILEYLDANNLFVVRLDNRRQWYRYHHLFADLLYSRLQQSYPERLGRLFGRASEWYEQAGLVEEAIEAAITVNEFERVTKLIERHFRTVLLRGKLNRMARWLNTLSDNWVKTHPQLQLIRAWISLRTGHISEAEHQMQVLRQNPRLDEILAARGQNLPAMIASLEGEIALMQGEPAKAIDCYEQALAQFREDEMPVGEVIMLNLAQAYRLLGNLDAAARVMTRLNRSGRGVGDTFRVFLQILSQAEQYVFHGKLGQGIQVYQQFLQLLRENKTPKPPSTFVVRVYLMLGQLFYERNQLEQALKHIEPAFELGLPLSVEHQLVGQVRLARIYIAQDNRTEALAALDQATIIHRQTPGTGVDFDQAAAMLARLQLTMGNVAEAEQWAAQNEPTLTEEPSFLREFEFITLARLLIARRQFDEALSLLERLQRNAQDADRQQSIIETLILQSLIYQTQDNVPKAIELIAQALTLAEPERFVRLFVDEDGPMAALLLRLSEVQQQQTPLSGATTAFLSDLLAAFQITAVAPLKEKTQPLAEPLTERELELLPLMAQGMSNREIAAQLIVSENTVKTHARNIFGKLNVGSRVQAVAKAKELGLL